ncbi:MAG: PAS domain-containing protein [Acidobacteriota bacterium]|nr:PAS domain-containing protein [Acidobacteriota bacterium]
MQYAIRPLAIAGFFVYVAFLWTLLLQHWIPYPFLFLFLGAVMGSAWFGGTIAGLISVCFSTVIIAFFFIPPVFSFKIDAAAESYFVSYIVCAVVVSWVSAAKKKAEREIREARDLLEIRVQARTAELELSNRKILERERQLRKLTEAIPQQIWSASPGGEFEYCNQHLLNYLGLRVEETRGARFLDVMHPDDRERFVQSWEVALTAGSALEGEWRVHGGDGNYRWFLIRSIPERAKDGAVVCWYGTHIDIEERRRAEQQLNRTQSELARLSRVLSLGELSASIAHEINQPLTALVTHAYACLRWLQASPANLEKATATAEKIVMEGTRAGAIVSRIRSLYQRGEAVRRAVDMNEIIRELLSLLREEAVRHGATVRIQLAPELPELYADRLQIQQVVLNLAFNALDAMAEVNERPRELTIRSEKLEAEGVAVHVEDCGVGLEPQVAEQMFNAFFTTKPEGVGMGLSICRTIIEAHDGRLWASSRQPCGAAFHFVIPAGS